MMSKKRSTKIAVSLYSDRHAHSVSTTGLHLLCRFLEVIEQRIIPEACQHWKRPEIMKTYRPPYAMTSRCFPRRTHSNIKPPRNNYLYEHAGDTRVASFASAFRDNVGRSKIRRPTPHARASFIMTSTSTSAGPSRR